MAELVKNYSANAIERARDGALDWLNGNGEGYPRSWEQEAADAKRRDYDAYEEDFEAPPIAGYEALEKEGLVARVGTQMEGSRERVHFKLLRHKGEGNG